MNPARCVSVFGWLAISVVGQRVWATEDRPPAPSAAVETQPNPEPSSPAVTSKTFSATGLTLPSLWWVSQQFAKKEPFGGKLLQDWRAYPGQANQPGEIDFVVNRQLWSLLDYLERYSFLDEFGATARTYGYNIRVLDSDDRTRPAIASYTCTFRPEDLQAGSFLPQMAIAVPQDSIIIVPRLEPSASPCTIILDTKGKAGLGGRPTTAEGAPRNLGTAAQ